LHKGEQLWSGGLLTEIPPPQKKVSGIVAHVLYKEL